MSTAILAAGLAPAPPRGSLRARRPTINVYMLTCLHVNIDSDKLLYLQRNINAGTRASQVSNAQ